MQMRTNDDGGRTITRGHESWVYNIKTYDAKNRLTSSEQGFGACGFLTLFVIIMAVGIFSGFPASGS